MKKRLIASANEIGYGELMCNLHYFKVDDVVEKSTGRTGQRYTLSQPLTEEQKAELSKYDNIKFSTATHRYAPEIQHDVVIRLDTDEDIKEMQELENEE